MNEQERQESLRRYHEMTYVPDEWTELINGDYKKSIQDIRLKDGTEIEECYPNAGFFHVLSTKRAPIPASEVTHVKANKKEW